MRTSLTLLTGCTILFFAGLSEAQDFPLKDFDPARLIDELLPQQNLDVSYEEFYENLMQRLANPIDLNRASGDDLLSLFVLSEQQVESVLSYRRDHGPFLSVYELQAVPGLDLPVLYRLMPFLRVVDAVTVLDGSIVKRMIEEGNNYFIMRYERTLEKKKGYAKEVDSAHRYAGSDGKLYWRFRTSRPGDFSVGITAEKDAGEAIAWSPTDRKYGMDFYSFHAQVLNKGRFRNMVVGDFQAQFGQGLVVGGGFGLGKSSETVNTIRRTNLGFMPSTSVNEFGFFRGAGLSYSLLRNLTVHVFGSVLRRDALTQSDSLQEESSLISSFAISGYHRTARELATRKQIREINMGSVLNYHRKSLDAGVILMETTFSLPLVHTPRIYNQFAFSGQQNCDLSGFVNFSRGNVALFGEVARTLGHGKAVTMGLLQSLTPRLDVSMLYRNFSPDFYSFYGNGISENTTTQNEAGLYWGLKYAFNKRYSLSGYVDLFRFPWLRYRGYAPSQGSEWMIRLNYQPSKKVLFFMQAREESKIRNLAKETPLYATAQGRKSNFWINCDYGPHRQWSFKTRAQFSSYRIDGQTSRGLALIQDVSFDIGRFSISARYALFDTENYDNRLYVYERDVALALSFPAYDGVGIRRYVVVQYNVTKSIQCWFRWAGTTYSDRNTIGSAGETITGNAKNDVKLQLRIRV